MVDAAFGAALVALLATFWGLGALGAGFFAPTGVRPAAAVAWDPVVDPAVDAAAAGFLAVVDACAVAGFAVELAVFVAEDAGVPPAAGFFTGVFEGVLPAAFGGAFAAGAFAVGAFGATSLSTILIFDTPSESIN